MVSLSYALLIGGSTIDFQWDFINYEQKNCNFTTPFNILFIYVRETQMMFIYMIRRFMKQTVAPNDPPL